MGTSFLPFLSAMAGKLDYNQANDQLIQGAAENDKDAFPTVERLIGIYFPDLEPEMKSIIASRDSLNQLIRAFRKDYEKGHTSNGPWLEPFRAELIKSDELANELKRKIVAHPIRATKRMPTIGSSVPSTRCRVR